MQKERINKIGQIQMQIATAERRLASAKDKVARYERRLQILQGQELSLRMESARPLGRATKKNLKKQTVWYCIHDCLRNSAPAGLTTSELYAEVREEHWNLNLITFRAYLREFSSPNLRLLEKFQDRWRLPTKAIAIN
jgi:hypothetical protein